MTTHWRDLFREVMAMIDRDTAGKAAPSADDLIHQMREERGAELLALMEAHPGRSKGRPWSRDDAYRDQL